MDASVSGTMRATGVPRQVTTNVCPASASRRTCPLSLRVSRWLTVRNQLVGMFSTSSYYVARSCHKDRLNSSAVHQRGMDMNAYDNDTNSGETWASPPVVDTETWRSALAELRQREKAATRELDAIAAQRRRLPMVTCDDYLLVGEDGPTRLVDIFRGKRQLITYHHMWFPGAEWQCPGCTGFTSQFARLGFLDAYDARFVIVTPGPIEEALAYKRRVGNRMTWYSTAASTFGADMDAPLGGGFQVNVFLRDGDAVYRTYNTQGRGTEQLGHMFGLLDLLPYGRQEEWQDSPEGWPQSPTYSLWPDSESYAR